ncbi:MAG: amino acid transporter [Aquimarina sp.]|nr:amino acid transporter [Aquimarina sp.]
MEKNKDEQIGLMDAISIGIGGMVGGGIFAVLGLASDLAKGGTPVAFLFAGLIALLTSYSYAKLSRAYPDKGGTVKFINKGFGISVFSGGVNNLLWISYIVMLALYASAFGSYAPNLFSLTGNEFVDSHIYATAIVLIASAINYYSVVIVGKIESIAVFIKLVILIGFVGVGFYGLQSSTHLDQLSLNHWESPISLVAAGMIIFVAYEGFELIANAAPNITNPSKNIKRAYFGSVIFVITLYILIAIITVGSLSFDQVKDAKDYVLAEAAKPMLGQIGFTIITIAALISTFSAINASLYGGSRVSYELSEDDELPHQLTYQFWNKPIGLAITSITTIILVNVLDLESISTSGSVGFLFVFACVNYVGYKNRKEIKGRGSISLIGAILCVIALVTLIINQYKDHLSNILIAIGIIVFCFIIELTYKRVLDK